MVFSEFILLKTINNTNLRELPCSELDGVGPKIAEKLAYLGIESVQDILFHLPLRYQDRTRIYPIRNLLPGDHFAIEGIIESVNAPRIGKTRFLCHLRDTSGRITLRFFYINAFQRAQLLPGRRLRCFGEVRRGQYGLEMIHPEYRTIQPNLPIPVEETLTPIYPTTEGLSQTMWRKLTSQALKMLMSGGILQDFLPEKILDFFTLPNLKEALQLIHRPSPDVDVNLLVEGKHVSQKRLIFEELLAQRLSLLHVKESFKNQLAYAFIKKDVLTKKFLENIPFTLTQAQQRVSGEIFQDLSQSFPMLRLVQGDVGSGKTVVAALAILRAVENGYQAALLAPTELLAEQHFKTFYKWFISLGVNVLLLTGRMKTVERREALISIAEGKAQLVIGTHAIFQKEVNFAKLALVVVDEQHRFGVEQRALLREKGIFGNCAPHQLIMTATPIPRTLTMSVYADLENSIIDEVPPGRTPVATIVISNTKRSEVLSKIKHASDQGRQIYWVCTLIEDSELLQCQAAEKAFQDLKIALSGLKVALIHGRMKGSEKEKIMNDFKNNKINLLVATTVIEVGVDVPNASLMIIENAERLGLAQLHQLRGRVGRGSVISHCVLMYQSPLSSLAKERLAIMRETTDGFKIAEKDLELRGPGEILGTQQTGSLSLRIANLVRDSELFPAVQQAADIIQKDYPHLIELFIKRWLGTKEKFVNV